MSTHNHLAGVYAAIVTPMHANFMLDLDHFPQLLDFLINRDCSGVLLFGTTGEGPSFSKNERLSLLRIAIPIVKQNPSFKLLLGTGTPSLEETIDLTKKAFSLGCDGVVVLPPYYFRKISEQGLFLWFSQLLARAVPNGKALFYYHIPPLTGIPLSLDLISRLMDSFPERFAGIKDSSGDLELAKQLGTEFGQDLITLTGNDRLFSLALESQAGGCITALANLVSPTLCKIWKSWQTGDDMSSKQQYLDNAREVMEKYAPFPTFIKTILAFRYNFPLWTVRPPLLPMTEEIVKQALLEWDALDAI